jgi:hypothetical protein
MVTGTSDHAGARQRIDDLVLELSDTSRGPVAQKSPERRSAQEIPCSASY